jgi:prepilin-type N-terminal cleavage/methylation domain-containing protein
MNKQGGFTLVEVLIAAVILFSALAITADLYKASSFTANRITHKANYYQATPVVIATIKSELRALSKKRKLPEYSGQFISAGVEYQWQATRTSFKSRIKGVDESFDPPLQFGLYNINVLARHESRNLESYTFKAATW